MKKRILSLLLAAVMLLTLLPAIGITANAEATNIQVFNATYYGSGALKSLDTSFGWGTASAPSRLVLMTKYLSSDQLTNAGSYGTMFDTFKEAKDYDSTNGTFGIIMDSAETRLVGGTNTLSISFSEGNIPLNVNKTYYIYLWTDWAQIGTQYYYPDYLIAAIRVQDGAVQFVGSSDGKTFNESGFNFVKAKETFSVTVNAAANMSTTGNAAQTGLDVPMNPVVYTADEGYHFPADYAVASVTGIKVTRNSATQITVSGMPTANTTIDLIAPTANLNVTVTPAANMTNASGEATQSVPGGAMTPVVYTADAGFYFPAEYAVAAVNGVSVTRDSETQITVSGTPTADAAITLVAPTRIPVDLENAVFGYAYDVQRSPAYPSKGVSITLSGLKLPYLSTGSQHTTNEGKWTLTNVGAYYALKGTEKDTTGLQNAVRGAASAYGVSANGIVVHELKDNGNHIAYGVVIMYDKTNGLAAYVCDTLNNGAGWLLTMDPQSGSVTGTSTLNTTDWIVKHNVTVANTENGTTTVSAATAVAGDVITVTAIPDDTYKVASVKYNDGADHEVTANNGVYSFEMPDKDVSVTVTYAKKTYSVTYKADGVVVGQAQTVEHGKDAVAPAVPDKTGHTGEWEADGKNITTDTVINAVYTPNKYIVKYIADGTQVGQNQTVEHGKDAVAPAVPAKEGYTGAWDADGKNITADTTINAVYTIAKYSVTYKADGVVVGQAQTVEHGKDAVAPTVPAKEGYTGAWDADGKNITADTTINAVYTLKVYKVTYVADGVTVRIVDVPHGQDATAPQLPAKEGYTAAWDKDGKNITADTTITAVYTLIPVSPVPSTGDETQLLLWALLAVLGLGASAVLVSKKRRFF